MTFKDIDTVHGRPDGTARKRFNDNKERFVAGEDYFEVTGADEIRTLGFSRPQGGVPDKIVLLTESGYLMVVKSLTDDLAWKVQRQLVNTYFRVKEASKPMSAMEMFELQARVNRELSDRVEAVENKVEKVERITDVTPKGRETFRLLFVPV